MAYYAHAKICEYSRSNVPADPIFQLVFPQTAMLSQDDLRSMMSAITQPGISKVSLRDKAEAIRATLNPHPAGQKQENVPLLQDQDLLGTQHKYRETILFFPTEVSPLQPTSQHIYLTVSRANSVILSALTASDGLNSPRLDQINSSNPRKSRSLSNISVSIHE